MKRYFIFQVAKFGDCLFATIVAKQIKQDHPDSHITWGISTAYKSILVGNPHVDAVVELVANPTRMTEEEQGAMLAKLREIEHSDTFDEFLHLQIHYKQLPQFCTTLRHTVLQVSGRPITVEITAVLNLTSEERANVHRFAETHRIGDFRRVILFECMPSSGQSQVDVDFAFAVAQRVTALDPEACFILTSSAKLLSSNPQIIDGSCLSFRENLELINLSHLLIGCSSGITWLTTCESARKIPIVQLLDRHSPIFAGVSFDYHIHKLDSNHIIERTEFTVHDVVECVKDVFCAGVESSRGRWNQDVRPSYFHLKTNLCALVLLDHSISELYAYARRFLSENARFGNPLPFGMLRVTGGILTCYARRAVIRLKSVLRPMKTVLHAKAGRRRIAKK